MSSAALTRLRKEYIELRKKPVENIRAAPKETDTLEWHYVIEGAKGSPYEGGWYHGVVTFPKDYPYKPPSIQMNTPNGRFKTNTRLCLSMSDFHPETWNPLWSVGTILLGLYTFMLDSQPTYGSIETSETLKRNYAAESLEFNVKNSKIFCEMFPELVELHEEQQKKKQEAAANALLMNDSGTSAAAQLAGGASEVSKLADDPQDQASWFAMLGILAAVIACTWALLSMSI